MIGGYIGRKKTVETAYSMVCGFYFFVDYSIVINEKIMDMSTAAICKTG